MHICANLEKTYIRTYIHKYINTYIYTYTYTICIQNMLGALKSRQACAESSDVQRRFERCKELTLGVDLDTFGGDGDPEDVGVEGGWRMYDIYHII